MSKSNIIASIFEENDDQERYKKIKKIYQENKTLFYITLHIQICNQDHDTFYCYFKH